MKWENPPLICIIWDDRTHLKLLGVCSQLTSEPSLPPMSVHSLKTITLEQRYWDFLHLRPVWPTEWVLQPHRKILSWNHKKSKNKIQKKTESNKDYDPTLSASYILVAAVTYKLFWRRKVSFLALCSSSGYQAHSFTNIRAYFIVILVYT